MDDQLILMFPLFDHTWTLTALHEACQMARDTSAKIVLVQMIPVQHLSWLGTEWANMNFTPKMQSQLRDYQRTIEDFGVDFEVKRFRYANLGAGIIQAADQLQADIVFAKTATGVMPALNKIRSLWMKWQLGLHHHELCEVPA